MGIGEQMNQRIGRRKEHRNNQKAFGIETELGYPHYAPLYSGQKHDADEEQQLKIDQYVQNAISALLRIVVMNRAVGSCHFQKQNAKGFDLNAEKQKPARAVLLTVLKNRNGRVGDQIPMLFYPKYNYFSKQE